MKRLLGAAAATAAMLAYAHADVINVRDDASNGSSYYVPELADTVSVSYNGEVIAAGTGPFSLEYQDDETGFWTQFLAFCLEFDQALNLPNTYEHVSTDDYFDDPAVTDAIGILYANFMTEDLGLADLKSAAAVQLVIWELVEDGVSGFDLTSGVFQVLEQEALDNANALWAMVMSGMYEAGAFSILRSDGSQDQLSLAPVPLPGALLLLLSGFGALRIISGRTRRA